jgi:hypothetical protein
MGSSKGEVSCCQKLRERVEKKFESVVVKNYVEFWRWQWKIIEKKWQERNQAVQRGLHVCCSYRQTI